MEMQQIHDNYVITFKNSFNAVKPGMRNPMKMETR